MNPNIRLSPLPFPLALAILFALGSTSATAAVHEAETLSLTPVGAGVTIVNDGGASGGKWLRFDANNVGDYIDLVVPSVPAGTYNVRFSYKSHETARGALQAAIDGTNQGSTLDQSITPNNQFRTADLGILQIAGGVALTFRFTSVASGTGGGFSLSIDTISLLPSTPPSGPQEWEAEALSYVSSGAGVSVVSDNAAGGGQWVSLNSDNVGDYVDFTLPDVSAGTYGVSYRYKSHNIARGFAQASVGGVAFGQATDQSILPNNEFRSARLGVVQIPTSGNQTLRIATAAAGQSGGYGVSIDSIRLEPPAFAILPNYILTGKIHLPSLLVTKNDTVLLLAQNRIAPGDKDPAHVVLIRSTDGGLTWSGPVNLFTSNGTSDTGYSCMLIEDRSTTPNTILALYTVGPSNWPSAADLVWYGRRSTDDGVTWNAPYLVGNDGNANSKPSNGGHGFQFSNGRLVIPGRGNFLYSDDHGDNWVTRGMAESPETKVVSLVDATGVELNQVYLITRLSTTYRIHGNYGDTFFEQGDHGNTFSTDGRNPGLARYSTRRDGPDNILLMAGIEKATAPRNTSITYSTDEGRSWSARKQIDVDGWYSEVGVLKDGTILVAYLISSASNVRLARFNLAWLLEPMSPPGSPQTTIVDNADATGVTQTGTWTSSTVVSGFYGSNFLHDGNTGSTGGKSVRFSPVLAAANYDVYVRWTSSSNRASNTPIDVNHASGATTFTLDQRANGNTWILLGTFAFDSGNTGNVRVRNDGANGYVVADAVQFVPK